MLNMSEIARRLGEDCPTDIRLLVYVLEHTTDDSIFFGTIQRISSDLNISQSSVMRGMKWLKEQNVIEDIQHGVWKVLVKNEGKIDVEEYRSSNRDDEQYVVVENKTV